MTKQRQGESARRKPIALSIALLVHALLALMASRAPDPLERAGHFELRYHHQRSVDIELDDGHNRGLTLSPGRASDSNALPSSAPLAKSSNPDWNEDSTESQAVGHQTRLPASPKVPTAQPDAARLSPRENSAVEGHDDRADRYDRLEQGDPRSATGPMGLSLNEAIAVGPKASPAPTTTPRATPVTGEDTARALEASIRSNDGQLGLGNPEEGLVASAVQTAGRATPVPSGTRARFAVDIDSAGLVTGVSLLSASKGGGETWGDAMSQIQKSLSKKPVQLGPNAKRKGVRVIVEATVLHVFASGSDKYVTVGACPSVPLVGGETRLGLNGPTSDAAPFGAIGGAAYGDSPSGTCLLGDPQTTKKQIVVRTKTQAIFPGEKQAPPPFDSMPAVPRARPLNLWRLLLGQH